MVDQCPQSTKEVPGKMSTAYNARYTLRRKFGEVEFEFSLETLVTVSSPQELSGYTREMARLVDGQIQRFVIEDLPKQFATKTPTMPTVEVSGGKLVVNVTDGKRQLRWKVGKWDKWGIPVYDEAIAAADIRIEGYEVDMSGWRGDVVMSGDRPIKVINIRMMHEFA